MNWNVIWQVDPDQVSSCIERDWFYEIISQVPLRSVHVDYQMKPLLSCISEHSIICASCPNQIAASDLIRYLQNVPKPRVLYHMSDEFVQVGPSVYQHCELVIRNGSANFDMFGDPRFIQLPLGYVTSLGNSSRSFPKSSDRQWSFAFLGTLKHDRAFEMLPAFDEMRRPKFVRKTGSFGEATKYFNTSTISIYKNAVFVPNPKGNWNPECNRLYDALEWGCIPLIKRYSDSEYHENYHDKLLGQHPIPTFDNWQDSVEFADRLFLDLGRLDALQAELSAWWQKYKSGLQDKVATTLISLSRWPM